MLTAVEFDPQIYSNLLQKQLIEYNVSFDPLLQILQTLGASTAKQQSVALENTERIHKLSEGVEFLSENEKRDKELRSHETNTLKESIDALKANFDQAQRHTEEAFKAQENRIKEAIETYKLNPPEFTRKDVDTNETATSANSFDLPSEKIESAISSAIPSDKVLVDTLATKSDLDQLKLYFEKKWAQQNKELPNTEVIDLQNRCGLLEKQQGNMRDTISDLQSQNPRLESLQAQITQLTQNTSKAQSQGENLQAQVERLSKKSDENSDSMKNFVMDIQHSTDNFTDHQKSIDQLQQDLKKLRATLQDLKLQQQMLATNTPSDSVSPESTTPIPSTSFDLSPIYSQFSEIRDQIDNSVSTLEKDVKDCVERSKHQDAILGNIKDQHFDYCSESFEGWKSEIEAEQVAIQNNKALVNAFVLQLSEWRMRLKELSDQDWSKDAEAPVETLVSGVHGAILALSPVAATLLQSEKRLKCLSDSVTRAIDHSRFSTETSMDMRPLLRKLQEDSRAAIEESDGSRKEYERWRETLSELFGNTWRLQCRWNVRNIIPSLQNIQIASHDVGQVSKYVKESATDKEALPLNYVADVNVLNTNVPNSAVYEVNETRIEDASLKQLQLHEELARPLTAVGDGPLLGSSRLPRNEILISDISHTITTDIPSTSQNVSVQDMSVSHAACAQTNRELEQQCVQLRRRLDALETQLDRLRSEQMVISNTFDNNTFANIAEVDQLRQDLRDEMNRLAAIDPNAFERSSLGYRVTDGGSSPNRSSISHPEFKGDQNAFVHEITEKVRENLHLHAQGIHDDATSAQTLIKDRQLLEKILHAVDKKLAQVQDENGAEMLRMKKQILSQLMSKLEDALKDLRAEFMLVYYPMGISEDTTAVGTKPAVCIACSRPVPVSPLIREGPLSTDFPPEQVEAANNIPPIEPETEHEDEDFVYRGGFRMPVQDRKNMTLPFLSHAPRNKQISMFDRGKPRPPLRNSPKRIEVVMREAMELDKSIKNRYQDTAKKG